jgi:Pyruvate/2-oxoacid:ferredoxin oxidoreductase delta subunit
VPDLVFKKDGTVEVDQNMMTGHTGLFAGGDMVPSERTVTVAMGHGKKAARNIDGFLRADPYVPGEKHELASSDLINLWYDTDAGQREQDHIDVELRQTTFDEVIGGLDQEQARFEARRCMSCGNCFECDACLGSCPEDAVIKLGVGKRYRFDYDLCTGCRICAEQCPCAAIEMIPEMAQ